MFFIDQIADQVTEGQSLSVSLTSDTTITAPFELRWVIVADGAFPVTFGAGGDFLTDSDVVEITQTGTSFSLTLPASVEDTVGGVARTFTLELYEVVANGDDVLIGSQAIELTDNDAISRQEISLSGEGANNVNVLGFGSLHNILANGNDGDDLFIVTRHNYGVTEVVDNFGVNTLRFDYGVRVTGVSETFTDLRDVYGVTTEQLIAAGLIASADEVITYTEVTFTLSDGGTVTLENPGRADYRFQTGDGAAQTYLEFRTTHDFDNNPPSQAAPITIDYPTLQLGPDLLTPVPDYSFDADAGAPPAIDFNDYFDTSGTISYALANGDSANGPFVAGVPNWLSFDAATGVLSYNSAVLSNGLSAFIRVTASDADGNATVDVFSLTSSDLLPNTGDTYWAWDDSDSSFKHYRADDTQIPFTGDETPLIGGDDLVILDARQTGQPLTDISFAGGADIYEVHSSLASDITIDDVFVNNDMANVLRIADGTMIFSAVEQHLTMDGVETVLSLTLTLTDASGPTVTIAAPTERFDYQYGENGYVLDYDQFVADIL